MGDPVTGDSLPPPSGMLPPAKRDDPVPAGRRFRKKPVVIEAIQFDGTVAGIEEAQDFVGPGLTTDQRPQYGYILCIPTLEGIMTAIRGDWIIKGVKGEFYPVKDDIFKQTYEAVDAPQG